MRVVKRGDRESGERDELSSIQSLCIVDTVWHRHVFYTTLEVSGQERVRERKREKERESRERERAESVK